MSVVGRIRSYIYKMYQTFRKKPSLSIPFLVLILILFWYGNQFQLPYIGTLLFLPNELNVKNEILDVLTPVLLSLFISFYSFHMRWFEIRRGSVRHNINKHINFSLLSKVITFLTAFIFYPLSKSFIGSNINTTVIDVVGYSSGHFPNFENVVFAVSLIIQVAFVVGLLNIFLLYSYLIEFQRLMRGKKTSVYRSFRYVVFLFIIVSNINLSMITFERIEFLFSDDKNAKEIKELLLVTSYNEIPSRCRHLLNVYGNREKALLSFIDINLASIYIVDDDVFINESCK